jgi:hypothetical protein
MSEPLNTIQNPVLPDTGDRYFGIEFASIEPVLQLYSQALSGREVEITAGELDPVSLRLAWWKKLAGGEKPDGQVAITVPAIFMEYPSYEENFGWYKSAITRQVGHAEFGSFNFDFDRPSHLFENLRAQMQEDQGAQADSFERFFSLFEDRLLAAQVFVSVENVRINYLVKHYYPGVRRSYIRMQEGLLLALAQLPGMTLRRAFCELLEGLEIDALVMGMMDELYEPLDAARDILGHLCSPSATVEDSAEAAIRIYNIARQIPRHLYTSASGGYSSQAGEPHISDLEAAEYMGNFQTDRIKLNTEFRPNQGKSSTMPMTAEDMGRLADKTIGISDIKQAQFLSSTGMSVADLPRGVQVFQFSADKYQQVDRYTPGEAASVVPEEDEKLFHYDEWDFRARRYIPEWCCIREKVLGEGNSYFFEKTLESRKSLLYDIKRQFEMLPAELLYKSKNLDDGDEYDLDQVIGEMIDRRAGHTPSGKVYWKKKKIQRDVAVVFLLDMSGSTADLIQRNRTPMQYDESIKYDFMKFVMQPRRRIIDLEKESIVLLIQAIESLGDSYGIYGFSGHGRSRVQFLVIKDLNECFSERVKRRVDQIAPIHGTRMGPAIRHATSRLDTMGCSTRLLFLVSDGYPQDSMYGNDDDDKAYAIHDTKMALIEASKKNITPFCLTVDSSGNDYLRTMCQDIGYEVLDDIEMLPHRLPMLYKKLSL